MLKWNHIDKKLLINGKSLILRDYENKIEHVQIAKKVLGLPVDEDLNDFKFELTVFGVLSECFFAAQFSYNIGTVQTILTSGQAIPAAMAFKNDAYRDDLLNLFHKEDEQKPDLTMLKEFIKSKIRDFQTLNGHDEAYWISQWSDVNSWACYWQSGDKFNCLAKMSG